MLMAGEFDIRALFGDDELLGLNQLPEGPLPPKSQVIREESFEGWRETAAIIQPEKGEKLILASGLTDIEVSTVPRVSVEFKWYTEELPKVLRKIKPEDLLNAHKQIKEMQQWMFVDIPKLLGFGLYDDRETFSKYLKSTAVSIKFDGDEKDTDFSFRTKDDELRFGINFAARSDRIRAMRIQGGANGSSTDFIVGVNYEQRNTRDEMLLTLPADKRGITACNGEVGNWLLGTHLRSANMGDLTMPGANLSVAMQGIVERTMGKWQR
jgi:hypothetical protein